MGWSMMNGSNLQETDGAFGDLHRIRRRTLVVVLCGAVLAALVMAAVLWAPGVNRNLRHKRGTGFAQAARQAMTNGKWEEAGPYVKAALELAPDDLTVLRIAAELCEHAGYIEAVRFRKMATYAPGATRDDRLKFARTALDFQAYDVAGQQIDPLLAEVPGDTEALKTRSALQFIQGNEVEAILTAGRVVELAPHDRMAEYTLGTLLFESADAERHDRGRVILWGLALGKSPEQRLAIRRLAGRQDLTAGDRRVLLQQARGLCGPTLEDQLALLTLRSPADLGHAAALTEALGLGEGRSVREKVLIAKWLNDNGGFEEMLRLLPLPDASQDVEGFTWHLTALGALRRWTEIEQVLERSDLAISEFSRHAGRAMLAVATKDPAKVRVELDLALASAPDSIPAALFVSGYATRNEQPKVAIAAWTALMQHPEFLQKGWQAIRELARSMDSPEGLIPLARRVLQNAPTQPGALADLAYALLVTSRDDPEIMTQLRNAAAVTDATRELIAIQALSLWRNGDVDAAQKLMETRVGPTPGDPLRIRIIAVCVFGATGQRQEAVALAKSLPASRLWLCERALIQTWLW